MAELIPGEAFYFILACYREALLFGWPDMNTQTLKNRLCGWQQSDFATYAESWYKHGGSFCTHPEIIAWLSSKLGMKLHFLSRKSRSGELSSIYYVKQTFSLYSDRYPVIFEDILLPLHDEHKSLIPIKTSRLSPVHAGAARNGAFFPWAKRKICYVKQRFSKSTAKKRTGERNKFLRAGGHIIMLSVLSNEQICDAYIRLFNLRWNNEKRCYQREALLEMLSQFRHFLFGHALVMDGNIIAIDLIFKSDCGRWIYFDDVNGGYDPQYSALRPGSVLLWENICQARTLSQTEGKKMIFSLGSYDKEWGYKNLWCDALPSGRTLI